MDIVYCWAKLCVFSWPHCFSVCSVFYVWSIFIDPSYSSNSSAEALSVFFSGLRTSSTGPVSFSDDSLLAPPALLQFQWFTPRSVGMIALGLPFHCSFGTHFLNSCPLLSWSNPFFFVNCHPFTRIKAFRNRCFREHLLIVFLRQGTWNVIVWNVFILSSHLIIWLC